MRIFLEKVVLYLPGIVNAQAIRQLDLIQRVLEEAELGAGLPGTRQLVLIEDPEFMVAPSPAPALHGRHAKEVAQYCASLPHLRPKPPTDQAAVDQRKNIGSNCSFTHAAMIEYDDPHRAAIGAILRGSRVRISLVPRRPWSAKLHRSPAAP